jgi:hypothetical protein
LDTLLLTELGCPKDKTPKKHQIDTAGVVLVSFWCFFVDTFLFLCEFPLNRHQSDTNPTPIKHQTDTMIDISPNSTRNVGMGKLDPFKADILALRNEGKSWREISHWLLEERAIKADHAELLRWVRSQKKKRVKINKELRPFFTQAPAATVADPIRTAADAAAVLAARDAGQGKQPTPGDAAPARKETMDEIRARIIRERDERKAREAAAKAAAENDELTEEQMREILLKRHLES